MNGVLGTSVILVIFAGAVASMQAADSSARDVDRQAAYVGAAYAAEAAAQMKLSEAKAQDVEEQGKVASMAAGAPSEDAAWGTVNEGADAGYFDARFAVVPSTDLDLGDVPGGDVVVRSVPAAYWFNRITIDYNAGTSEDVEVTVARSAKSSGSRCGFDEFASGTCQNIVKFVANSADKASNGVPEKGFRATFGAGEGMFASRATLEGFDPDAWDYRITFSTLSGKPTNWSYRAWANSEERKVANNVVELNAVGTAIDQYSRVKIQKRVSDEMQPLSRYVLFSDGEIAK